MQTRIAAVLLAALALGGIHTAAQTPLDDAFETYWKAADAREAAKAAEGVLKAGADFETLHARLAHGRTYRVEKTGTQFYRAPAVQGTFENRVDIPDDYDPSTKLPLRVQLHGGVMREQAEDDRPIGRGGRTTANRIAGEKQIVIQPSGWIGAPWWSVAQMDNIARLIDQVTRRYNVDESQIYLTGISDGGTGCYYVATHDATRWSAVMPLNGSIIVLRNPATGADDEVYPNNLVNTPLFIVNGGRDPLYPVADVSKAVEWMEALGVTLQFRPQPLAGHDTSWWPTERETFERFVHGHRREAHPDRLSWETDRTDRFNREKWLVIDKLGRANSDVPGPSDGVFRHKRPSGRVDVRRDANVFVASSRGVKEFRLLLSPDVVDFGTPVTVTVNGRPVFSGAVTKDPRVLMTWHARDNDRTMLYGAELRIVVP